MRPQIDRYLGVPFRAGGRDPATGLDCWGLVRAVMADCWGLVLPDPATDSRDEAALEGAVAATRPLVETRPVDRGAEVPGDLVLLRGLGGRPVHVGVVVRRGWVLHADPALGAVCEPLWQGRQALRVVEIGRPLALAAGAAV